MSSEDRRIVILEFDNSKFDSNVEQSRKVLDKLKSDLNFEGASKGLESISASAKKFSLSNIGESIGTVTTKFSSLEIIGKRVLENLTDTAMRFASNLFTAIPNQIASGGWSRALKLEQANFQLRGLLGETAEGAAKIEAIMDSVSKSVKGTAYGLDDAAKVASQLVATGIEDSQEMLSYLKGVAGAAAMTGGSYEDIGRIFTTVAGQGRLMGDQLLQFATRGVNVAATLSKQMNITEAEFRDLVSKGQISFKQFADGMALAFGEHAYKANETFTGSLANMKAALSRIGADVATPALTNLRDIFNALRPLIDGVHDALQALIDTLNINLTKATEKAVTFINALTDKVNEFVGTFKKEAKGAEEASETIVQSAEDIEELARRVIRGDYGNGEERRQALEAEGHSFELVQNKVNELLDCFYRYEVQQEQLTQATTEQADETARLAEEQAKLNKEYASKSLNNVFGSIGNIIRNLAQYARIAGSAFREVFSGSLFEKVFEFTKRFRNFTDSLYLNEVQAEGLRRIFVGVFTVIEKGLTVVGFVSDKFFGLVGIVANLVKEVLGFVGGVESVEDAFKKISENFSFGETLKSAIENINYYLGVFVLRFRHTMRTVQNSEGFQRLQKAFTKLWETIKKVGDEIGGKLASKFKKLTDANPDFSWLNTLGGLLEKASDKLASFIEWMIDAEGPLAEFYHWAREKVPLAIDQLQASFIEAKNSVMDFLASFNFSEGYNQFIENLRNGNWSGIADQITAFFNQLRESLTIDENGDGMTIGQTLENIFAEIEKKFLAVQEYLQNVDWKKIKENALMAALTIEGLLFFFGTIKLLFSVSGFLSSARAVIDKFTGRQSPIASISEMIKSVAILVGVLAGSLYVMSKIDNVEDMIWLLLRVLGGIAAVFVAIGTMPFIKTAKMAEFGNAVKGFGIGVALLVPSLTALGLLPWKIVMKGIGYIGLIAIELGTAARIAGSVKAAAAFMGLAVAVDLLVPAILLLGLFDSTVVYKGAVTIGLVVGELALAARIAGSAKGALAFLGIALAVNILAPIMMVLGNLPLEQALQGAGVLGAIMLEIGAACRLAKGTNAFALVAVAAPLGVAMYGLKVLSDIPPEDLLPGAIALGMVMKSLEKALKMANDATWQGALTLVAISVPLATAAYALYKLSEVEWTSTLSSAFSISRVLTAVSKAISILGEMDLSSGLKGIVILDGFIFSLAAVFWGIGALFGADGPFGNAAIEGIQAAIPVMENVGKAIGALLWGILDPKDRLGDLDIVGWLRELGDAVGGFGTQIQPFIDTLTNMDINVADKLKALGIGLLEITGSELLDQISSFIGGEGALEAFGQALADFGDKIGTFASKSSGVDGLDSAIASVEKVAKIFPMLRENGIFGGVVGFFAGQPLVHLVDELWTFAVRAANIIPVDAAPIESVKAAMEPAVDAYKKMKESGINGGIVGMLEGNPMGHLGNELRKFSLAVTGIQSVDSEAIQSVADVMPTASDAYKSIQTSGINGGLVGMFEGNPMWHLGKEISLFSGALQDTKKVDKTVIESVSDALEPAITAYQKVTDADIKGGLISAINSLWEGTPMHKLGTEINDFATAVADIPKVNRDNIVAVADSMGPAISAFTAVDTAGIKGSIGDYVRSLWGGGSMETLARELMAFSNGVQDIKSVNADAIVSIGNAVGPAADGFKKLEGVELMGGLYSMIGEELSDFAASTKDIESVNNIAIDSITGVLPTVIGCMVAASSANIIQNNVETFNNVVKDNGEKFKDYSDNVTRISYTSVDRAIEATYDLIEVGKAMAYVNTTTMANFGRALENVGHMGVNAFIRSFTSSYSQASSAANGLIQASISGGHSAGGYTGWWNVGISCINGFINALASSYYAVQVTAMNVGVTAANGLRAALGVHSPSRVFYEVGDFSIQGFVNAFIDGARDVFGAGETMGDVALKALTRPVQLIQQMLDTDLDLTPTITPVLDLTDLANGTTTANGLLSGISGQMFANSLNVGSIQTGETEASYQSKQLDRVLGILSQLADEDSINPVNNTFNIYGDDPRAIADEVSRIIQRQVERREASWA